MPDSLLTNLVSYWPMDQAAGANANDVHTGYTFSQISSPGSVSGKIRLAANLNGIDSYYFGSNDAIFAPGDNNMSISIWVRWNSLPTGGDYDIIFLKATGSGEYQLYYDSNIGWVWYMAATIAYGNAHYVASLNPVPEINKWYHCVATYNATTDLLKLYINGFLVGVTIHANGAYASGGNLRIGKNVTSAGYLNGQVDEVAYWRIRELTHYEVLKLYNNGNGLQYPFNSYNNNKVILVN